MSEKVGAKCNRADKIQMRHAVPETGSQVTFAVSILVLFYRNPLLFVSRMFEGIYLFLF